MSKRQLNVRALSLSAALAAPVVAMAATSTWTGPGASWNDAANWDSNPVLPADIAAFGDAGLTAGKVITLDAPQMVNSISLDTTTAFTIGNAAGNTAGHTLTLGGVTRSATSSGVQSIAADLVLANPTTWNIAGANYLSISKATGAGAVIKAGPGEMRLGGADPGSYLRSGSTTVDEGTLSITAGRVMGSGSVTVGDGTKPAALYVRWTNNWDLDAIGNASNVLVRDQGIIDYQTYYTAAGNRNETIGTLALDAGAQVKLGKFTLNLGAVNANNVNLQGGTISATTGSLAPSAGYVTVDAAASEMATIDAGIRIRQGWISSTVYYTKFVVNDTAGVPVDLKVTGAITNGNNTKDGFDKTGAGLLKITGSSTYGGFSTSEGATRVQVGTLLVDNAAGSGTGSSYVTVSGGATLGGIGTIGGLTGSTNANVNATGVSAKLATLSPGTIGDTTGEHLLGTLTVGSVTQNNNVVMGNYSQLLAMLGNAGSGDQLSILGNLDLSSASNTLALETMDGATLSGEYVLASFTGTLTGRFDTVTLDGGSLGAYELLYRDSTGAAVLTADPIIGGGSVVLAVPEPGTAALALGGLLASLALRRRSVRN